MPPPSSEAAIKSVKAELIRGGAKPLTESSACEQQSCERGIVTISGNARARRVLIHAASTHGLRAKLW